MRLFQRLQDGPAPVASVLAAALMLALPNIGQAITWCVPGPIDGLDCNEMRPTINGAIGDAAPGDTIRVKRGSYDELVFIWKKVTLLGAQAGVDARGRTAVPETVITSNGGQFNLGLTSAGSVIDGFTFSGGVFGIQSDLPVVPVDDVVIRNNRFSGFRNGGIMLIGPGNDITIEQNVIDGPPQGHVDSLVSLRHAGPYHGVWIVNNEMVNGGSTGYGLSISASAISIGPSATRNPTIKGNLFSGNVTGAAVWPVMEHGDISDNRFIGNGVHHGFQGTPKSTVIARNSFNDNQLNGMNLVGSPSNNIITDNEFAGNHGQGLAGTLESTVVARNSFRDNLSNGIGGGGAGGNVTIRDNEFRGNVLSGLAGNYSNSTVDGNLFADNGAFGIQVFTPVHDTTITGNLMMRNGLNKPCVDPKRDDCGGGIEFGARTLVNQHPDTNHVHANTLSGNRFGAYYAYIATSPPAPAPGDFATLEIPMAGNYWGTTSGPFHPVRNVSGTGNAAYDRQATDASAPGKILFYPWLMLAPGDTPRKLSQAAAADLNALLPTGSKQTDDRIGKAVNAILDSMKPSYWAGDFALTGKGGKVFDEDRKAVNELQHVTKAAGATVAAVKESIEDLVVADEVLARTAIWAAADGNGSPAEIAKARDEFAKAVSYQAAGNWDNAVDHFKKAWEHATRAL